MAVAYRVQAEEWKVNEAKLRDDLMRAKIAKSEACRIRAKEAVTFEKEHTEVFNEIPANPSLHTLYGSQEGCQADGTPTTAGPRILLNASVGDLSPLQSLPLQLDSDPPRDPLRAPGTATATATAVPSTSSRSTPSPSATS